MKRFLSMSLAIMMCFTFTSSALAVNEAESMLGSETVVLDGEIMTVRYRVEGNYANYIEIGDDVFIRQGNDVFMNGVMIATITTTIDVVSDDVQPRTGWIYNDGTCPAGSVPTEYRNHWGTKNHNLKLLNTLGKITQEIIFGVLATMVPFNDPQAAQVFGIVAGAFIAHVNDFTDSNKLEEYLSRDCIYATEQIYSGKLPYTHKNYFYFYSDSAKTDYVESAICYSSWA